MFSEFFDWNAWALWFAGLEREYVFLLALPFVVAVVGLWSWWVDKEELDRDYEARAARAADGERRARARRQGDRRGGAQLPHHGLR